MCIRDRLWAAYDWFQGRYLRAFNEHTAVFSGDALQLPAELAGPGPIRLVHFWDPACPCNVGNQQHLAELIEHYGPQGVEFYSVQKAGSHGQLPTTLSRLKILDGLPGSEQIPASPGGSCSGSPENTAVCSLKVRRKRPWNQS